MAIIYNDTWLNPPGNYVAGELDLKDTNWSSAGAFPGNVNWQIITTSGGALQLSVVSSDSVDYWNAAATWTPLTIGAWSEFTFKNLLANGNQLGLVVAFTSPSATPSLYLCRIRATSTGGVGDITFYKYVASTSAAVTATGSGPWAVTFGATDVCALQLTYDGTTSTLTFFQNYVANVNTATDTSLTTGGPSAIWQHNMTAGGGDLATARGGTGLYPGNPAITSNPTIIRKSFNYLKRGH